MNVRLFTLALGGLCGLAALAMSPSAAAQGLEYTAIDGCRVLDTRKWNGTTASAIPAQRAVEFHLSNEFGTIPAQGGSATGCPTIPADAAAFAVTITAVSPVPRHAPARTGLRHPAALGLGDLGDHRGNPGGEPHLQLQLRHPSRGSSNLNWDDYTFAIANTTIVKACESCSYHARLYTLRDSHFVVDVVGVFTEVSAVQNLTDAGLLGNLAGDIAQNNSTLQVTLNADLLDGLHASSFASAVHNHDAANIVSGTLNVARYSAYSDLTNEGYLANAAGDIARNNGALQVTLNADLLDGIDSTSFAAAAHNHDMAYVNVTGDWMSGSLRSYASLTYAVNALGGYGPTDGFLGVQGSTDFDGEMNADWAGRELGVVGISTGSSIPTISADWLQ